VLGCLLGPVFYLVDADTSLLTTGLLAGSLGYWVDKRWMRAKAVSGAGS
jgi:hypothetical protein